MKANYTSNKYLALFFSLTLSWTWVCGFLPIFLGSAGTPLGTFIFYFGGGAPSVVALFLVFLTYPSNARKDYFHRCFSIKRMGWKWPLFVVILFTIITLSGLLIGIRILNMKAPGMSYISIILKAPYMLVVILLLSFVSGPLNEEFGWRGYALDKLLVRFGFTRASLILGFIWAIWHLPWYLTPGQAQYNMLQTSIFNAIMFIPSCTLFNFVVTFIYIKTNRSVLAGAFVHMMGNLITSQLLSPYTAEFGLIIRYVEICFSLIIIIYTITSKEFKAEVNNQVEHIKSDESLFCRQN